jgi:hypothetical protein
MSVEYKAPALLLRRLALLAGMYIEVRVVRANYEPPCESISERVS